MTSKTLATFAAVLLTVSAPAMLAAQTAAPAPETPAPVAPPTPPATPPAPETPPAAEAPAAAAPASPSTTAPPQGEGTAPEAAPGASPEAAPDAAPDAVPDEGGTALPDLPPPSFTQVELTADTAKKAVDSLILIQEKYKDADFGDPSDPAQFAQSMKDAGVHDQVLGDLKGFGFTAVEDWARSFMSLWLAASFIQDGQEPADVDKEIAEIEADTSIPADEREATVAWLKAMRPSEKNMEVVRELYADPAYKAKLEEMLAIDAGEGVE